MLHEVNFLSYNKRDQVQGWIYVPAARPKGIVQIIHGFGEHSRRYLHMIVKFMDAGYIERLMTMWGTEKQPWSAVYGVIGAMRDSTP